MNELPPDEIARVTDALARGSQADEDFVEAWAGAETRRRQLIEALRGARGVFPPTQAGEEVTERVSLAVAQRIGKSGTVRISKAPAMKMPRKGSSSRMWGMGVAASIVAVAGVMLSKHLTNPTHPLEGSAATNRYVTGTANA